jgi:hypothetical protein
VKRSENIIEDFDSIRRHLNRLENERARTLSAPAVVIERGQVGGSDQHFALVD